MEKEKMTKLEKQWVLYDVGNSAFVMLVSTIIPIYFKNMATASGISAANATAYGKDVGISDSSMLLALLLTQMHPKQRQESSYDRKRKNVSRHGL